MIEIPDQTGRVAVVTGANSGLGLHAAKALAGAGAHVVLACRSPQKSDAAVQEILDEVPAASIEVQRLDLADLSSVHEAAAAIAAEHGGIDLLLNNAGIMAVPRGRTADGFELQFGTNHLGHFAFTGLLLPSLLRRPGARVVTVSSVAHGFGRMFWGDLNFERFYERWLAYGQSKLANLLFARELDRRLRAAGHHAISVAAHPGIAKTHLVGNSGNPLYALMISAWWAVAAQSAQAGTRPILHAATAAGVRGGGYYGPLLEGRGGGARRTLAMPWARDDRAAHKLWSISEELTGVRFDTLAPVG